MNMLFDLAFSLVLLGILKGVIEPAAGYWGGRVARRFLPKMFEALDPLIPDYLLTSLPDGITLEQLVTNQILRLEVELNCPLSGNERAELLKTWEREYSPLIHSEKVD